MRLISLIEDLLSFLLDLRRLAVMDGGWGQQAQGGVPMLVVVPVHECPGPVPSGRLGVESLREVRPILHRFELGLGEGIIIRCMRSTVGLGDPQISQQFGDDFGPHR
jgi:hypothetical protein